MPTRKCWLPSTTTSRVISPRRRRAALRLADAYLMDPAATSDVVKQEVAEHLSVAQVVELAVKLMGFSSDKVMVALGLDIDEVRDLYDVSQIFTM